MGLHDRTAEIVSLGYRAAADPALWPHALRALATTLNSKVALIGTVDLKTRATTSIHSHGWNENERAAYRNRFFDLNPRVRLSQRMKPGEIFFDAAVGDDRSFERSAYYGEFLHERESRYFLATNLVNDAHERINLTIHRTRAQGHAQARDIELLRALAPHFAAAFDLHRYLRALEVRNAMFEEAIEDAGESVLLVDGSARLLHASRAAAGLLDADNFLRAESGYVEPVARAARHGFTKFCGEAQRVANGESDAPPPKLTLTSPTGEHLAIRARPMPPMGRAPPSVLLILTQEKEKGLRGADELTSLFGLSPSETALALSLARGMSLKAFAEARRVSINTARSQLAALRGKLGAHSQADIVRRVLTALLQS